MSFHQYIIESSSHARNVYFRPLDAQCTLEFGSWWQTNDIDIGFCVYMPPCIALWSLVLLVASIQFFIALKSKVQQVRFCYQALKFDSNFHFTPNMMRSVVFSEDLVRQSSSLGNSMQRMNNRNVLRNTQASHASDNGNTAKPIGSTISTAATRRIDLSPSIEGFSFDDNNIDAYTKNIVSTDISSDTCLENARQSGSLQTLPLLSLASVSHPDHFCRTISRFSSNIEGESGNSSEKNVLMKANWKHRSLFLPIRSNKISEDALQPESHDVTSFNCQPDNRLLEARNALQQELPLQQISPENRALSSSSYIKHVSTSNGFSMQTNSDLKSAEPIPEKRSPNLLAQKAPINFSSTLIQMKDTSSNTVQIQKSTQDYANNLDQYLRKSQGNTRSSITSMSLRQKQSHEEGVSQKSRMPTSVMASPNVHLSRSATNFTDASKPTTGLQSFLLRKAILQSFSKRSQRVRFFFEFVFVTMLIVLAVGKIARVGSVLHGTFVTVMWAISTSTYFSGLIWINFVYLDVLHVTLDKHSLQITFAGMSAVSLMKFLSCIPALCQLPFTVWAFVLCGMSLEIRQSQSLTFLLSLFSVSALSATFYLVHVAIFLWRIVPRVSAVIANDMTMNMATTEVLTRGKTLYRFASPLFLLVVDICLCVIPVVQQNFSYCYPCIMLASLITVRMQLSSLDRLQNQSATHIFRNSSIQSE